MRYIFLLFFTVLPVMAQSSESYPYSKTSVSDGARYEITQSTLAAKYTFRLDKFTGRVWQVVRTQEDRQTWQEVPVIGFTADSTYSGETGAKKQNDKQRDKPDVHSTIQFCTSGNDSSCKQ